MARITSVWKLLALGLLAQAGLAQAQQTPSSAPPKLERIEDGYAAPAPAPQRNGNKVVEKREGGRITEVQVNSGRSSSTMKATPPDAVGQTGDAPGSTLRPPQWKVLEFDIGRKKPAEAVVEAPPPPAPPPAPPVAK
jgi:hypothetical protein